MMPGIISTNNKVMRRITSLGHRNRPLLQKQGQRRTLRTPQPRPATRLLLHIPARGL